MARTNPKTYEPSTPTKVAFIGLGVMGYLMAGHLALAGHHVTVYNRNPAKAKDWCAEFPGHASAATPREAAQAADMVFCCVGNDDDLRAVMLGADGAGRVAAHELLYATPAVRNLIRESKTAQLPTVLQTGAHHGMQTLAQGLAQLVSSGVVSPDEAMQHG